MRVFFPHSIWKVFAKVDHLFMKALTFWSYLMKKALALMKGKDHSGSFSHQGKLWQRWGPRLVKEGPYSMEAWVMAIRFILPLRTFTWYQKVDWGCLGGSVSSASNFSSGHDLTVHEFKPLVRLCADSSEPGPCFRSCVSFSLCLSPTHAVSPSLKNKH